MSFREMNSTFEDIHYIFPKETFIHKNRGSPNEW